MSEKRDIIIVGGGLSGLLTAWRSLSVNPNLHVTIIEASAGIGGDHTWSFNRSDIAHDLQNWITPFIVHEWGRYDVQFPKRARSLNIAYCSGDSNSLRAAVQPLINAGRLTVMVNQSVAHMSGISVTLPDGQEMTASLVLDARGFVPNDNVVLGYQKFVGQTIRTAAPHGLKQPVIMDATVPQVDGYRFVYLLPFSDHEILVEDTYYADGASLSENEVTSRLQDYIAEKGWADHEILRREKGVLPITLAVDEDYGMDVSAGLEAPVQLGMRGGYYHAVTGYSVPEAVKSAEVVASFIAKNWPDFTAAVHHEMVYHKRDHYREERFLRLLNRMLFRAAKPQNRYKVLQRFYGLSEGLVARFYRNRLTKADKLRLLIGKPPVPISKAVSNLSETAFLNRERQNGHES